MTQLEQRPCQRSGHGDRCRSDRGCHHRRVDAHKLDAELLRDLPNTNRRLGFEVIHQAPGVWQRSAFGSARDANSLLVDGTAVTMPQRAGIDAASMISVNWMEEVQIVGLGANAEYGEFTGIVSNMVMRSGSNRFSGLVEGVSNRPRWASSNTGSLPAAQRSSFRPRNLLSQNIDGQIGGPLRRDRVFFFSGGQYFRERLRALKVPAELIVYPREGHGITERVHRLDMLEHVLEWYDRHLKSPTSTEDRGVSR